MEQPLTPTTLLRYLKPMTVSAQYAATHFDEILSAAENGEEVEIVAQGKLTFKLAVAPRPVPPTKEWAGMDQAIWQQPERPRSELFGSLAGKIELGDDWDSPETNRMIQDLFEGSEDSSVASRG